MQIQLDPRLQAAARMVRQGRVAADIGTDHGYLICELVRGGRCPRGYACDINAGPLQRAQATIAEQGLDGSVQTRLTDGLQGLPWREIGDFIIAGMGGDLIGEILEAAPWTRSAPDKHYILQPMTKAEKLRGYLYARGFVILEERAVISGRFAYTVLSAAYRGKPREVSELFAWTGLLPQQRGEAARACLGRTLETLRKKADGLAQSRGRDNPEAKRYADLAAQVGRQLEMMRDGA